MTGYGYGRSDYPMARPNPWFSPPALQYVARFGNPPEDEDEDEYFESMIEPGREFELEHLEGRGGVPGYENNPYSRMVQHNPWFSPPALQYVARFGNPPSRWECPECGMKLKGSEVRWHESKCQGREEEHDPTVFVSDDDYDEFGVRYEDNPCGYRHNPGEFEDFFNFDVPEPPRFNPRGAWHAGGGYRDRRGSWRPGSGRGHHHFDPEQWHPGGGLRYRGEWRPGAGHWEANPGAPCAHCGMVDCGCGCGGDPGLCSCHGRSNPGEFEDFFNFDVPEPPRFNPYEDDDADDDWEEEEILSCAQCGGPLMLLGQMGSLAHYRCRNCGWDQSRGSNPRGSALERVRRARRSGRRGPARAEDTVEVHGEDVPVKRSGGKYHHIRVADPSEFERIRTKVLSETKGISARIGIRRGRGPRGGRTEIQSYLLTAEKYSPSAVIRWIEGHEIPMPLLIDFTSTPTRPSQRRTAIGPKKKPKPRKKAKKPAEKTKRKTKKRAG